jgi:predicted chitinase
MEKGFIALITLLILFLISLSIGIGLALRSIGRTKTSLQINQSSQAFYLANLCVENALMKLKENINYSGNETIQVEGSYCQILPIEGKWTIKIIGNFQNQVKKVKIIVNQVNPQMIIQSWQEVPDF